MNARASRPGYARKSLTASKGLTVRRPLTAKGKLPEDDPDKHWEIERFGPIYLKWGTKVGFQDNNFKQAPRRTDS